MYNKSHLSSVEKCFIIAEFCHNISAPNQHIRHSIRHVMHCSKPIISSPSTDYNIVQWSIKYVQKLTGIQTILRTRIQPKINKKSWKNQMNTRNEIWIKCEVHGSSAVNISNWFYETRESDVSADRVNEWRMRVVRTKMMNWQHEQNQVNAKHGRPQKFFAGGGQSRPLPFLSTPLLSSLLQTLPQSGPFQFN